MKTREQISNMRRLADHIEAQSEQTFQWYLMWLDRNDICGTTGCVAGHAVALLNPQWVADRPELYLSHGDYRSVLGLDVWSARMRLESDSWYLISEEAARLLGLESRERLALFSRRGAAQYAEEAGCVLSANDLHANGGTVAATKLLRAIADRSEVELDASPRERMRRLISGIIGKLRGGRHENERADFQHQTVG